MAVIVTNGATNLSATGAYYRAESYNLCPFNNTNLDDANVESSVTWDMSDGTKIVVDNLATNI